MPKLRIIIRTLSMIGLTLVFVAAGVNHFLHTEFYMKIMPPYLPAHKALIEISGVCEIVLGLAIWIPALRKIAGWGLLALLIAVFPANIQMALHPSHYDFPVWAIMLRLPFQLVFAAWVYWTVIRHPC